MTPDPGSIASPDRAGLFRRGANLPWIHYGGDFGANGWSPEGGLGARGMPPDVRLNLERLRAAGTCWLRWFVLCDGRAGIRFDAAGLPVALDDFVRRDLDAALDLAASLDLKLVLTLFDFHWFAPARIVNGVQTGGRRAVIARRQGREALLHGVVEPLLAHVGPHPAIAAWDVMNEPEWATFGVGTFDPRYTVRRSVMRRFLGDVTALAHARTGHAVTVGLADARSLDLVRDLGLDFYQVHWYEHMEPQSPLTRAVSTFGTDRPVMLGEFPTRGSRYSPAQIVDVAMAAGYAGAWFWSVQAQDGATDRMAAMRSLAAEPVQVTGIGPTRS